MFYKILSKVIKEVMLSRKDGKKDVEDEMKTCYWAMNEQQRESCLRGILSYVENSVELYLFILSYLMQLLNDKRIVDLIVEILNSENELTLVNKINILGQLNRSIWLCKVDMSEVEKSKMQLLLFKKQLREVLGKLNQNIAYIPYDARNHNRIIMLIEPMLGARHAPTKKMANIYNYLESLGYDVYVYATNYKLVQIAEITYWWKAAVTNALFEENTEFKIDYYGVQIKGCYVMYSEDDYFDTIRNIREEIRQFNPAFVLTIGDSNILGDSCQEFTDVVTMGCTNTVTITASRIIARYFANTEEIMKMFEQCLEEEQTVVEYVHADELEPLEELEYTRESLQIEQKDFVIIIAGNRLDAEVKQDVIDILNIILKEELQCKVLFIGDCKKLEKRLQQNQYWNRFRFVGETENFRATIALGDLFLNPPRKGGGTGALYAAQSGVPVLTLGNCDVAYIGERVVCDKLEDMPEIVHRYIYDEKFMREQKEYCKQQAKGMTNIDNIAQTKKFCEEVINFIKKKEEGNKD